jgi:hypothetical protein
MQNAPGNSEGLFSAAWAKGCDMRQTAGSMGRPVVLFAVMIVLCCLPGCGAITGALGTFDEDEDSPVPRNPYDDNDKSLLQHRDDDADKPSLSLQPARELSG